jgi:predicted MFS family arabinose efflux permease
MFSVYSYAAEYLRQQTGMTEKMISLMMVVFGIGGVSGNLIAGRLLAKHLIHTALLYPVALAVAYLVLLVFGSAAIAPMSLIVLIWGGIHTSGLVVSQIWLTAAAPEAPEFATSLFVSSANAGVMLGSLAGGVFITRLGMPGAIWCGLGFAALSFVTIATKAVLFGSSALPRRRLPILNAAR